MRRLYFIVITLAYFLSGVLPLFISGSQSFGMESVVFTKKAAAKTAFTSNSKTAKHIASSFFPMQESSSTLINSTLPPPSMDVVTVATNNIPCRSNPVSSLFRKRAPPAIITA